MGEDFQKMPFFTQFSHFNKKNTVQYSQKKQGLSFSEKLLFVLYGAEFHSPMMKVHAQQDFTQKYNLFTY